MSIWFEGSSEIKCNIQQIKHAVDNYGEYFIGIVGLMPGLTSVELIEQGSDFVTIQTNEGLMKRTNISKHIDADTVVVEFDEEYQAKSMVTVNTHFLDEFTATDTGVTYHSVLSGVEAPGFLGFFYRNLGKSSIGNAILTSYKTYFEKENE
jgi:hypothetical protein